MKRKLFAGVAALLALSALTACGSRPGSSASATNGPIQIGTIEPNEDPTFSGPWLFEGAQAAVDEINAAGGIDGRKLQLNTCNGAYDPATELRCAQQAVQGDDVAMVGQLISNGAQVDPLFTQAKMANVGVSAISGVDAQAQSSFVLDPTVVGYVGLIPTLRKELGATKVAVLNTQDSAEDLGLAVESQGAKAAGVDITKEISVPADATDMSLYVSEAIASGAQALVVNMLQTQVLATWKSLAAVHSSLKVVVDATSVSNNLKAAGASANGSYGISSTPAGDSTTKWGRAFIAAMKKYQPGKTVVSGGMSTYEAVYLFAAAAKKAKGGVTRASVWQAMNSFNQPFAWFSDLNYTKPGPVKGFPRIGQLATYPGVVKNGVLEPLPAFDPTQPQ